MDNKDIRGKQSIKTLIEKHARDWSDTTLGSGKPFDSESLKNVIHRFLNEHFNKFLMRAAGFSFEGGELIVRHDAEPGSAGGLFKSHVQTLLVEEAEKLIEGMTIIFTPEERKQIRESTRRKLLWETEVALRAKVQQLALEVANVQLKELLHDDDWLTLVEQRLAYPVGKKNDD